MGWDWELIRGRAYAVLTAAAPLAVLYGLATDEVVALWLGVASAALGTGTAAVAVRKQRTGQWSRTYVGKATNWRATETRRSRRRRR